MDESQKIILYMIAACVVFMLVMIFQKPLKILAKMLFQAALGLLCVFLLNYATAPLGFAVGINLVTGTIIGLLGVPGFLCLYSAQFFL